MEKIKLIIFDLDGTLVNAYPAIIRSFNYVMRQLKYPAQKAAVIRRAVGWGDESLLQPFIKTRDLKPALSLYRQHHRRALLEGSRLFPNVIKLMRYLQEKGYKIAVASNRPTRFSWILIQHLKLNKYFDDLLCADKIKYGKPHPGILNRIRQRFSLVPSETLYVGDMAIDAQAGRRAKIKTIVVTTGSSTKKELKKEKPYRIITKLSDLFKIL